jgi:hypothetical protein
MPSISELEKAETHWEGVEFPDDITSPDSFYNLYALRSCQRIEPSLKDYTPLSDAIKTRESEVSYLGDEYFRIVFEGINKKDAHEICWGMQKIARAIHEYSTEAPLNKSPQLKLYPNHGVATELDYMEFRNTARTWASGTTRDYFGFASQTESQRFFLREERDGSRYLFLPVGDKANYPNCQVPLKLDTNSL